MRTQHFKEYLMIKGYTEKSRSGHLRVVNRFKKWLIAENIEEETVSYNDVLAYVKSLQRRGVKQRTVQLYMNALRHYFTFLQSEIGTIESNPVENIQVKGIKRRHLYDLFTGEELDEIYQSYEAKSAVGKRNKIILGLMIYQGLKSEDLANLQPENLKLREGKIEVRGTRKSNERKLELRAFQIIDIQDYIYTTRGMILALVGKESDKLFVSMGHSERFSNMLYKLMKGLKKRHARIKSAKQIRASVITGWLKQYNLRKAQYMAGHRYVSSTEMYQVGNLEDLKADIEKYHPVG